ncbi:hypothetical protein EW146_g3754 [Bondarzewia mesenterica]|uniref:Uncharacterized protein n=1 Tax=Bondarzewia mesenterica TaxID=1095465 RepID=A0A4V3XFC8_9AGAM|nr:hypothetical protein EW146_g3754 [Bondarzewia mesenterica]
MVNSSFVSRIPAPVAGSPPVPTTARPVASVVLDLTTTVHGSAILFYCLSTHVFLVISCNAYHQLGNCVTTSRIKLFLALLYLTPTIVFLVTLPIFRPITSHVSLALATSKTDPWAIRVWWSRWYSWVCWGGPLGRWVIGTFLGFRILKSDRRELNGWFTGEMIEVPHSRIVAVGMAIVTTRDVLRGQTTLDTIILRRRKNVPASRTMVRHVCVPHLSTSTVSATYASGISHSTSDTGSSAPHGPIFPVLAGERLYDLGWRENLRRVMNIPFFDTGRDKQLEVVYAWPKINPLVLRRMEEQSRRFIHYDVNHILAPSSGPAQSLVCFAVEAISDMMRPVYVGYVTSMKRCDDVDFSQFRRGLEYKCRHSAGITLHQPKLLEPLTSCFFKAQLPPTMFIARALSFLAVATFVLVGANAESHTVTFNNKCGRGTPLLLAGGKTLSTGRAYTHNGPLTAAIAFLQTGSCGANGEGCTLVETTLVNPSSPGSGSSTDISLIPPHAFSVATGFGGDVFSHSYYNGCDRSGADCRSASCSTAFHQPDDTHVQVACQSDNVNLVITFCD